MSRTPPTASTSLERISRSAQVHAFRADSSLPDNTTVHSRTAPALLRIPHTSSFESPNGPDLDGTFAPLDFGDEIAEAKRATAAARVTTRQLATATTPATPHAVDQLAMFTPMVTAVRLVTVAISLFLAATRIIEADLVVTIAAVILTGYSTMRAIRPIRYTTERSVSWRILGESVLVGGIVVSTGAWSSPFAFGLLAMVVIAGFARGFGDAAKAAAALTLVISGVSFATASRRNEAFTQSITWTCLLLLIAVVAGVGRNLSGQADRERDLALDRLGRLADANALLYSLHQVAQTLPSSLDMDDVIISTVNRLRDLIEFDSLAIFLLDETSGDWETISQDGCRLPRRMTTAELPAGMRRALSSPNVVRCDLLGTVDGDGLDERSGSALYGALSARGTTTGLIAIERRSERAFDHRSARLFGGFVPPLAMALDNAQWFARLRTVGANDERNRIARDLHDRIGQSLAFLAFELDRLIKNNRQHQPIEDQLEQLREDLRGVVREVRDTLYDLRTDVTERVTLEDTLTEFGRRVEERSGIAITIDAEAKGRIPLLQEREMWRIAQEALTNVERHSQATAAQVVWRFDGQRALIRIIDNGIGFQIGKSGRLDSYGMLGMKERASSIGATLDIHSKPGEGTSVTCVLHPSDHPSRSLDRSLPGART